MEESNSNMHGAAIEGSESVRHLPAAQNTEACDVPAGQKMPAGQLPDAKTRKARKHEKQASATGGRRTKEHDQQATNANQMKRSVLGRQNAPAQVEDVELPGPNLPAGQSCDWEKNAMQG